MFNRNVNSPYRVRANVLPRTVLLQPARTPPVHCKIHNHIVMNIKSLTAAFASPNYFLINSRSEKFDIHGFGNKNTYCKLEVNCWELGSWQNYAYDHPKYIQA